MTRSARSNVRTPPAARPIGRATATAGLQSLVEVTKAKHTKVVTMLKGTHGIKSLVAPESKALAVANELEVMGLVETAKVTRECHAATPRYSSRDSWTCHPRLATRRILCSSSPARLRNAKRKTA